MSGHLEHEHDWRMIEEGYTRIWSVDIGSDGRITPCDDQFTDDGDGQIFLECDCGVRQAILNDTIDWLGF